MINEHDNVILVEDIPEENLKEGDVGPVVHVHGSNESYEVEFMSLTGDTIAVTSVRAASLRAVAPGDVVHVRELAVA